MIYSRFQTYPLREYQSKLSVDIFQPMLSITHIAHIPWKLSNNFEVLMLANIPQKSPSVIHNNLSLN